MTYRFSIESKALVFGLEIATINGIEFWPFANEGGREVGEEQIQIRWAISLGSKFDNAE